MTRETLFGDRVTTVDQAGDRVEVTFEHAAARSFELVVGADGLHSAVRELAFGERTGPRNISATRSPLLMLLGTHRAMSWRVSCIRGCANW